jgi:ABC-type phosphate transport system substrate-binding protein
MFVRLFFASLMISLALSAAGVASGMARASELVVIVSARAPLTSIKSEQVANIFMGEPVRLPDGMEAVAVDQRLGSAVRDTFYAKVANRTPALMKAYWTKMIFTGRGQPPREVDGNAAVRKMVADNPDLVGYIERSELDNTVRAVLVIQ